MKLLSIQNQVQPVVKILEQCWRIRPSALLLYAFGALLETFSFLGTLYASAKLSALLATYSINSTAVATHDIWLWLWIDIVCAAGIGLGFWLMPWANQKIYFSLTEWSTQIFHNTMYRLDIQDFYDEKIRNEINKVSSGYTWQLSNLGGSALDLCYGLFRFFATTIVVWQIAWWLVPLIALFLIPSLVIQNYLAKVGWFVWDEQGDSRHVFWGLDWIIKQPKNQMEIRSSQAAGELKRKIALMLKRFYDKQNKVTDRGHRLMGPAKILEVSSTAIGSIFLLGKFLSHAISLQNYFFLSGALLRISGSLNNIFGTLGRMQEPIVFASTFFSLTERKAKIIDRVNAIRLENHSAPRIEFVNVSFTYPNQKKPVFENLSFTIEPGDHIAFVGENGAGKSTLIKLLLRFYLPTSGQILIDGIDLKMIEIDSWYDKLATLFQDFNQYPFSIAENIEIGRSDATNKKQRLKAAASRSNVDDMIAGYKHGWQTVLDNSFEKGIEPSGGQWQRVALARAFFRESPVIILDEPTSAIDAKAEYDIFNSIFKDYKNKTALIISHRFSTVRQAKRILVVEGGKIVEAGDHASLMKNKKLYFEMFTKQAEGYKD